MNWVEIKGTHINTHMIQTFFWEENELIVCVLGFSQSHSWRDPDQALYRKICAQLGVRPYEEAAG